MVNNYYLHCNPYEACDNEYMKTYIALTTLLLSLSACAPKKDPICLNPVHGNGTGRLVVFGDSQTYGAVSPVEDCPYSWANHISQKLDLELLNTAWPGTNFDSTAEYGNLMTVEYKPTDIVMMVVSFNDAARFPVAGDHLDDYKAKLAEALAHVSPQVASVTVGVGLHPYTYFEEMTPASVQLYADATADVINTLALPNIHLVTDLDTGFIGDIDAYAPRDRVHIMPPAQDMVGDAMMEWIH